jgi:hypothetical protein
MEYTMQNIINNPDFQQKLEQIAKEQKLELKEVQKNSC